MFYDSLTAVLVERTHRPADKIRPDVTLAELDLDDFVSLVELALVLQETYRVDLLDGDISTTDTVSGLTALLQKKGAALPVR